MSLLTDLPVDEDISTACVVLGRALFVAVGFEDDCRSLAFVLKVREPQPEGQSEDEFFDALSKVVLGNLAKLNNLIAQRAGLNKNYVAMIHAARNARNYIVHEAVSDFECLAKAPDGISQWHSILTSKLEDVSYGKIIVAVLLSRNTAEPTPTRETIDAYCEKVHSWVFGSDAKPLSMPG